MMGSRGEVPPAATTLALLGEIAEFLRAPESTLTPAVAELKKAEAAAKVGVAELDKARAAHDARQAELDRYAADLTTERRLLVTMQGEIAEAESSVCQQEAGFAAREADLSARETAADERDKDFEHMHESVKRQLQNEKDALSDSRAALVGEIERARLANETMMRADRDKAAAQIAAQRAAAKTVIDNTMTGLKQREDRVVARETAIEERAKALSAALAK